MAAELREPILRRSEYDTNSRSRSLPVPSQRHYVILESCLLLLDCRKFQQHTLVVCQIFISIRDRKSEDLQWDIRLDLKETVGYIAEMFQER